MKIRKQITVCAAILPGLLFLPGCSHSHSPQPVNEIRFLLDDISNITISYDEEKVSFYEGEGNELTVREYMTENNSRYYAKTDQKDRSIRISEGGKPFFKAGFSRYIEVYLPASYHENLMITTTNGDIDISEMELKLNALRIDSTAGAVRLSEAEAQDIWLTSTSGSLELGELQAGGIRIGTTSGSVTCERLAGNVNYTTTSGDIKISSAAGLGSYRADNSGTMEIVYTETDGDLTFYNKNDSVHVVLPPELEFEFEATTKNGEISTSFQECVSTEDRTVSGTVGKHLAVTVRVETKNGNIEVEQ